MCFSVVADNMVSTVVGKPSDLYSYLRTVDVSVKEPPLPCGIIKQLETRLKDVEITSKDVVQVFDKVSVGKFLYYVYYVLVDIKS